MRPTLDQDQMIDRFLRQEMSPEERVSFEAVIEKDPIIREEIILRKDIIIGIKAAERQILREKLAQSLEIKPQAKYQGRVEAAWQRYGFWLVVGALASIIITYVIIKVIG